MPEMRKGMNIDNIEEWALRHIDAAANDRDKLKSDLSEQDRLAVLKAMNQIAKTCYMDFELQAIPIVTDQISSNLLQVQNAVFQRAYMQSIWLRSGFLQWYDHIYCFLQKLETRELAQKMFKQRLAQQQMKAAVAAA